MELRELIEKVEATAEGSAELDARVAVALRVVPEYGPAWWVDKNFPEWRARPDGRVEVVHEDGTGGVHWEPPPFTTSLDAARTLHPEGYGLTLIWTGGRASASIGTMLRENEQVGRAATPELAWVAACLKAHEAKP